MNLNTALKMTKIVASNLKFVGKSQHSNNIIYINHPFTYFDCEK